MTCILEWKCYCEAYFKSEVAIFFGKVVVVISHALEKKVILESAQQFYL